MAGARRVAGLAALVLALSACVTIGRVNTSSSGGQSATTVGSPARAEVRTSADGRYVVFVSQAKDLVPGVTDGNFHVYRKDRSSGAVIVVDVNGSGTPSAGAAIGDVSDDGHLVAFLTGTALVNADQNALSDAYVRDVTAGTTTLVSLMPNGTQIPTGTTGGVFEVELDATGARAVFEVGTGTIPPRHRLELRDLTAGTTAEVLGDSQATDFYLSGDGEHIITNMGCFQAGGCFPQPYLIDLADPYPHNPSFCSSATAAGISDDGRYVVYSGGIPGPTCPSPPTRFDRLTGATLALGIPNATDTGAAAAAMSGDGRMVVLNAADDALPGGTAGNRGYFLIDALSGHAERITANAANVTATGTGVDYTDGVSISKDGRTVVFASGGDNLVGDDTNGVHDVFARIAPVPVVTTVTPSALARGASHKTVTITGAEFLPLVFVSLGDGVTVHSATPNPTGTQLVLDVSVAANAATGGRVLTVANPAAVGIAGNPCACFTVT